jgi:HK97 family phage major capsid protein
MELQKLIDEKVKLINDARALHGKEKFEKLDEEQFDKIMNRVEEINASLKREESIKKFEPEKIVAKFLGQPEDKKLSVYDQRKTDDYNRAFDSFLRNGPRDITPEFKNILTIGTPAAGGFLVPTTLESMIIDQLEMFNPLRSMCTVISTSNPMDIPISTADGAAAWTNETIAATPTDPVFAKKSLGAYKMTKLTLLSKELLQDNAVDLLAFLARSFGRAFGALEGAAFLTGTGTNQPLGIITDPAMITQAAAAAAAISVDDIINLEFKVKAPYRVGAQFLMNDNTYKAISLLKDASGAYYLRPALAAGAQDTFSGYPINISEFMPNVATGLRSVAFGNFSYIWIGDRLDRTLQVLNELYSVNGEVGYLMTARTDLVNTFPAATAVLLHP